jgi:hypothetical protein
MPESKYRYQGSSVYSKGSFVSWNIEGEKQTNGTRLEDTLVVSPSLGSSDRVVEFRIKKEGITNGSTSHNFREKQYNSSTDAK